MSEIAKRQFVRQQGFTEASPESCAGHYPALMFQPRVLAGLVVLAILLQSAAMFLILAGILWWNALLAARNPFDALYNRVIAARRRSAPLPPSPAPRRFAQGMAGTILAGAGLALLAGWSVLAWSLQALVVVALGALVVGRFCLGSYLYHRLRGATAPTAPCRGVAWSDGESTGMKVATWVAGALAVGWLLTAVSALFPGGHAPAAFVRGEGTVLASFFLAPIGAGAAAVVLWRAKRQGAGVPPRVVAILAMNLVFLLAAFALWLWIGSVIGRQS